MPAHFIYLIALSEKNVGVKEKLFALSQYFIANTHACR
jgi:hypothetical protein